MRTQQVNKDMTSQWDTTSQRHHRWELGKLLQVFFFSNFFILYLIFVLADTLTNPQPTQHVKIAMAATAAAVAARDTTRLELLARFII